MHPLAAHLQKALAEAADPAKAEPMQAYLKTDQPFYGVQAGPRRDIFREGIAKYPVGTRAEYEWLVRTLWTGTHREEQHIALDLAQHYRAYHDAESWPLFAYLVHTAVWWDTLDPAAVNLAGAVLRTDRSMEDEVRVWREEDGLWVRRASLLVHLKHKDETNVPLLAETILLLGRDPDFFIRKAIGWVLREYAKTDPSWVWAFIRRHPLDLSPLSQREALKHLT